MPLYKSVGIIYRYPDNLKAKLIQAKSQGAIFYAGIDVAGIADTLPEPHVSLPSKASHIEGNDAEPAGD